MPGPRCFSRSRLLCTSAQLVVWCWLVASCQEQTPEDASGVAAGFSAGSGHAAAAGVTASGSGGKAGGRAVTSTSTPSGATQPMGSTPNGTTAGSAGTATAGAGANAAGAAASGSASGAGVAGSTGAGSGASSAAGSGGSGPGPATATGMPNLFFLDNLAGRVLRVAADGSSPRTIVQSGGVGPDGVAVDVTHGHVFWTTMGVASADDGTVMRADLDGKNVTTIIKTGTFTPKQLTLEPASGKLYWSDREGMRVLRANLDGTGLETLVTTGQGDSDRADQSRHCVGIAVDVAGGKLYWTQKGGDNAGQGSIRRVNLELPAGADPAQRSDLEVLFSKLPEPIDLALDVEHHYVYWTDRGDNTVSRAPLDLPAGADPAKRSDREVLVKGLGEVIGISIDVARGKLYYTSLSGALGVAGLDGSGAKGLLAGQGTLTGIVHVDL